MTCSKCGASLVAGARFCGSCGNQTDAPAPAAAARAPTDNRNEALMRTMLAPAPSVQVPAVGEGRKADAPARPVATPGPQAMGSAQLHISPALNTVHDLAGAVLNNRYQVKERLGEGGFGAVYRGEQMAMGRECAIKVLHGRMARDPQIVGRFKREAQAASVLKAAHTVAIYDFDQTPEGVLYLAMELLHGSSLHAEMQKGPMNFKRVAHIIDGIADSLGEAHVNGIVHRDIKPENVYLETRGGDADFAKVLDFGIAKIVSGEGQGGPQLTAAGQTLGTVEYMSPEQLMGQPLDGRSDLYALGVLAYELLVGHLPFAHLKTPGELITAHLRTVPQPPSQAQPDLGIPAAVDKVVMKLIEKQRDNRYKDAAELQADLRKLEAMDASAPVEPAAPQAPSTPSAPLHTERVRPIAKAGGEGEAGQEKTPERKSTPPATQGGMSPNTMYLVAGAVLLVIAALAAFFLFGKKAGAAELPPPARLIPATCQGMASADVARIRDATPPAVFDSLVAALRPALASVGTDPDKVSRLAVGLDAGAGRAAKAGGAKAGHVDGALLVVDLPVDKKKFEASVSRQLKSGERLQSATYKGVKYRKSSQGEFAFLPDGRVVLASGAPIAGAIDLSKGQGAPLMDAEAAALLERVGVAGGRSKPAFAWSKLDESQRRQLERNLPGLFAVEEAAGSFDVGAAGADLAAVGRCGSAEGAKKALEGAQSAIARMRREPIVSLLGLGYLPAAIKVDLDGNNLVASLHLTPEQYATLATRASAIAAAGAHSLASNVEQPSAPHAKR